MQATDTNGKIDMILTKSISRFARNTVDCLKYTRELKALNIAVFFEKENINTLDAKGEVPEYLDGKSFKKIKQGLKQTAYSMVQSMRSGMTPTSDRSLPTRSISVMRFSKRPTRSAF